VYDLGMPSPFRALILDLGEVLVRSQAPERVQSMADVAGTDLPTFKEAYWRHRPAYDLDGLTPRFWGAVLDDCRFAADPAARAVAMETLSGIDTASWTDYRDEVWDLAARFKAAGGRTALLSNGITEIADRVRAERGAGRLFDAVVISCEVGCAKPAAAIYELVLSRLGVAPGEALFVDDRPENLEGAERLGIHTFHFVGDASVPLLRERLELPA
jgi:putative hydrolase of the HAD superfamily